MNYSNKGHVLIGDFHSHAGNGQDFIEGDGSDNLHLPLPDDYIADSIPVRTNCNSKVTLLGRTLLHLRIFSQIRMLNNRTTADNIGYYTCYRQNGRSTVDNMLVNLTLHTTDFYC